jgi:hemolysin activation/secretion protein/opacity protein-like surface antigen
MFLTAAIAGYGVVAYTPANAQSAATINPRQLAPEPSSAPAGDVGVSEGIRAEAPAKPANAGSVVITVREVWIDGGFPELAHQTEALVSQIEGRRVTLSDVYKLGDDLQRAYVTAGYTLAHVVVPVQDLQGGRVHISIVDGFIESLNLSGMPERFRSLAKARLRPLIGQRHMLQNEIERRVLLLSDLSGLIGSSSIVKGTEPGGGILTVTAVENLISAASGVDNRLPGSLGFWEIGNSVAVNNAFGWGEQVHADVSTGTDFNHLFDSSSQFHAFGAGITLPVGTDGLTIAANASYVRTFPTPEPGTFGPFDEGGVATFDRITLRATYPVLLTAKDIVRVQLGFEHVDDQNRLSPFPLFFNNAGNAIFDSSRDRYEDVRLAAEWLTNFPWSFGGQATTAIFYTHGFAGRTAGGDVPLSQPGASPIFDKFKVDVRIVQPLPENFQLALFVRAQTSFGWSLMLPEQLSLDGVDALSGFSAGTLNVDTGAVARGEVSRTFITDILNSKAVVAPYLFAAAGGGVHEDPFFGQAKNYQAESVGGGVRANTNFFGGPFLETLNLEIAKNFLNVPFVQIPYFDGDYRASLSYILRYNGTPSLALFGATSSAAGYGPAPMWTGLYAGLNAGFGFGGDNTVSNSAAPVSAAFDARAGGNYTGASATSAIGPSSVANDGFIGGGQIGYSFRRDRMVFGGETDIQGSGMRGLSTFVGRGTVINGADTAIATSRIQNEKSVDYFGTLRAKLGYVLSPTLLAYGTGGLAYGGVSDANLSSQRFTGSIAGPILQTPGAISLGSHTLVGWTLGGGLEWMFTPNMSFKAEYLYYDLGSANSLAVNLTTASPVGGSDIVSSASHTRFDGHIVRAGLNYYFDTFENGAAPGAGLGLAAFAEDEVPRRWGGFYGGLNAGYSWDASPGSSTSAVPVDTALDNTFPIVLPPFALGSALSAGNASNAAADGALGGAQVGYNVQQRDFVFGAEADLDGAGISGRSTSEGAATVIIGPDLNPVASSIETEKSVNWLATLRGRLGYLANPKLLTYGTGGLAIGGISSQTFINQQYSGPQGDFLQSVGSSGHLSSTLVGWTAGGGLEWMFTPNMSLKAEYLYYDLGHTSFSGSPLITTAFGGPSDTVIPTTNLHFNGHVARVGLNYHFNFLDNETPVRAAY